MSPIRFGIYAGVFWLLGSLLLVALPALGGSAVSWSELDFRPLTALVLLVADALGQGAALETVIRYAELGIPITARGVAQALATAGADGFATGVLTALVYNAIASGRPLGAAGKALAFGVGLGAALGVSSFLLSAVAIEYGFDITEFDFTIRPLWLALMAFPGALPHLRESYLFFPGDYAGAAAWGAWGFVDGLIGGFIGVYVFMKARKVIAG